MSRKKCTACRFIFQGAKFPPEKNGMWKGKNETYEGRVDSEVGIDAGVPKAPPAYLEVGTQRRR